MNHKNFQIIRLIGLKIILAIIICIICAICLLFNKSNQPVVEKLLPVFVIIGVVFLICIILFGKIFCGFLCPLGFFFDIIWRITEKLHLPKLYRDEKFMKIINIFNKIFLTFFICGIIFIIGAVVFFPKVFGMVKISILVLVIVFIVMIIFNLLARRFFCNVCPIGSFLGIFEKFSVVKLEKDCDVCTMCGACYEACPMRIKSIYTETKNKNVSNSKCIYCGECIKKCQENDALTINIFKKTIYKSSRKDFIKNQFADIAIKTKGE